MEKLLDLLGRKVSDKVTKLSGVVESVSVDLYGCVQAMVRPTTLKPDGTFKDAYWLDVNRLNVDKGARASWRG